VGVTDRVGVGRVLGDEAGEAGPPAVHQVEPLVLAQRRVVVEAADGQQALDRAQATQPDLILMDRVMPVMDGLEATRQLRQLPGFEAVPILSLSASASAADRALSLKMGANAFLTKPVVLDRLLEQMGGLLNLTWRREA